MTFQKISELAIYELLDHNEITFEAIVAVSDEYAERYELNIADQSKLHRNLMKFEVIE